MKLYNEEIYAGLETAWSKIADFFIRPGEGLQVSKLFSTAQGNPAQIILQRAGPDNVNPLGGGFVPPETLPVGSAIAHIDYSGFEATDGGFSKRNVETYARYQGYGLGSFHIKTSGKDRLEVGPNGELDLTGCMSEDGKLRIRVGGRVIEL